MVKLVCYGVRETEVPFFEEINKKFGYDIKLVLSGLNDENTSHTMPDSAQTNSEHHVTPYIPVDTTQTYYTNLTSKVDAEGTISEWNQKIYFYNSEKQYITVRKYDLNKLPTVKIKVDFPENTAYVRVYFHTGYTAIKPYFGLDSNNITV